MAVQFRCRVSLVLFVGTVGLWTLSYWRPIGAHFSSEPGELVYSRRIDNVTRELTLEWWGFNVQVFGVPVYVDRATPMQTICLIAAPCWKIVLFTAILPAIWLGTLVRRSSKPVGHCPTCGYNLTGNTSGVCPECWRAIVKAGLEQ